MTEVRCVAWTYMVPAEDGLTKGQIAELLSLIPDEEEVLPFDTEEQVEANSVAIGFILVDAFDSLLQIQERLALVCNDWTNERPDCFYATDAGRAAIMRCDVPSI